MSEEYMLRMEQEREAREDVDVPEVKQICKCGHPIDDHVPDMECSKCNCVYYEEKKDAN
jgi:hypothetical protein